MKFRAGGHISGGHYNPAVTLAVFLCSKCRGADVVPYMLVQVLGAAAAATVVMFLKGHHALEAMNPDVPRALLAEFLYTFALCYVVLNVATARATNGNSFYGLAIGFTVMVGAFSVGQLSGGVFNPAVAVGLTVMGLSKLTNLWIYLAANFAASIASGTVFLFLNPQEFVDNRPDKALEPR